jgi:hypothetical protein
MYEDVREISLLFGKPRHGQSLGPNLADLTTNEINRLLG